MSTPIKGPRATPTKKLTPVVEIPPPRTRSGSSKRPLPGHSGIDNGGSSSRDAKRPRRDESSAMELDSPTRQHAPSSRPSMSNTSRAPEQKPTMALDVPPVAGPLRSQASSAARIPTASTSSAKKLFTMPGQHKPSRRTRNNIADLMGGSSAKAVDLGLDDGDAEDALETEAIARDLVTRRAATSKDHHNDKSTTVNGSHDVSVADHGENTIAKDGSESPPISQNTSAAKVSGHEDRMRAPSPATTAATASMSRDTTATPTKQSGSKYLAAPGSSAKKRTPTKAAKLSPAAAQADNVFLLMPEASSNLFATPPPTPERSSRPVSQYPSSEILKILQKVLKQLSSPTFGLGQTTMRPLDPSYKKWLASLPCLSPSHASAEQDARNILDRTIRDGEGNCLLLIGERGVGKSAIIDRSLATLEGVYPKDSFLVVRLSGLVQRDDKAAVREIARQLCSSAYIDDADEGNTFNSNANILSTLLAILEPGQADDPNEAASKSKPLIFIIDEFDLFAHSAVRQSMLYCLLDCVQGGFRRGGMAVVGVSARADCFESLEKRVKSRCQSRVHHILPAEDALSGVAARAKSALLVDAPSTQIEEDWNAGIETFFEDKIVQAQLTAMNDLRGLDADRKLYDVLMVLLTQSAWQISQNADQIRPIPRLSAANLTNGVQLPERSIPSTLNIAEVSLLIAAKHLTEEEKPVNFVVAFERYVEHSKRAAASGISTSRAFNRGLCLRAFERLKILGLVKEVSASNKQAIGGGGIFRLCRLVPWPFMIDEAIKSRRDIPQHLAKWCKAWSD